MKKNMLSRFTVNRLFRFLPSQLRKCDSLSLLCGLPRYICDKPLLKYDLYEKEQKRFRAKVTDLDLFWLRVLSMNNEEKVFDEDLKVAWYLAEEEYLPELMQLTVKYLENCKSYVDHFKFGSLMMRTCHRLNKPDEAFQLFCNPIISRHLDETMSIVILLDLLIDSEKYEEAVYVCDSVLKWEWFFVLRNPLLQLLYIIALYKQGSPEALSKACQLLKRAPVRQSNQRRTENLIFLLAIKLSEKSELAKCVNRPSTSLSEWNLKVQGLALLSQWDVLLSEISDKHDKIFKDTHTLIHELNPQISKQFSKTPLKLKVEDQLLAPITSHEFQGLFDERKKYYG